MDTGTLRIADVAGRSLAVPELRGSLGLGDFAWSPGADVLAVTPVDTSGFAKHLWLVRPDGMPMDRVSVGRGLGSVVWSPDGSSLAYGSRLVELVDAVSEASPAARRGYRGLTR